MKAHCLFEQSGTFKNEFKKLGIEAYDYDILNDFGQTDFQIDLFKEIEKAYEGGGSVFDNIKINDVVMSFFPCVKFCEKAGKVIEMSISQYHNKPMDFKIEKSMHYQEEQTKFYKLFCKMILVCMRRKIKLIIENPFHPVGYLTMNMPLKPAFIDKSRNMHGDDMRKPTQFFFINCEPQYNLVDSKEKPITKRISHFYYKDAPRGNERSMINPDYANWFIRAMILKRKGVKSSKDDMTLF